MSGAIDGSEIFIIALVVIAAFGATTDLIWGKIYNWITVPALVSGVAFSLWYHGMAGGAQSALGAGAALLLYGWMFFFGAMGAGDVKFLMALGAWGGLQYIFKTAVLGVVLGGIFAIGYLFFRGTLKSFVQRMYHYFLTIALKELNAETPKLDYSATMPFGIPIAIAAVWVALGHPFELLGVIS